MPSEDARRSLPAVERVIAELAGTSLPPALVADCARRAIDAARARIDAGHDPSTVGDIVAAARSDAEDIASALLRRVINATGVIIHTNLGRSPLDVGAVGAGLEIATGYSNLEYR
ncbi:MAG TPA: L-seryl-tRNA(Sec) selenium transferase, partial [Acidimicrobiia bacterium]|nr:L-seryl-tRNA(Sec) selenium transferase [Acidimicrobiia bacterium]